MLARNEKITQGATEGCFSMQMTNEEYHAEKGYLSTSGIKLMLQSPAHFKRHKRKETPDMALGTALHMLLLEPGKFHETYTVFDGERRGKAYTEFVEANAGKVVIKSDMMNKLAGMRESVMLYPKLNMEEIFREGSKEFSVFWEDPETGVPLKARADNLLGNIIFDVKKTTDARPEKFVNRCVDLRYDIQAYVYKEGFRRYLGEDTRFMFIAIEDEAPYGVWVYDSSPEMEERGEEDARKAIETYARCLKDNKWPMYDEPLSRIAWPHWMAAKGKVGP